MESTELGHKVVPHFEHFQNKHSKVKDLGEHLFRIHRLIGMFISVFFWIAYDI